MKFLARDKLDTVDQMVRALLGHALANLPADSDTEVDTWSDILMLFDELKPSIGLLRDQVIAWLIQEILNSSLSIVIAGLERPSSSARTSLR